MSHRLESASGVAPSERPLWIPGTERIKSANLTRFTDFVGQRHHKQFASYDELHDWSVANITDFWADVWDFTGIKASRKYDQVVDDLSRFPGANWFPGARMNFAENLLRRRDNHTAIVFKGENIKQSRMTYAELYTAVARLAAALRKAGVKPGDTVAGYMPNLPETAIAMLATTGVGATWASCASDLGPEATIDRIGQINPRILFANDGYFYKGKAFSSLANVARVVNAVPSIERAVIVRYTGAKSDGDAVPKSVYYDDFVERGDAEMRFEQLPPEQPVFVMFSSGTTGKPKCIVQGAGGVLANHLKELVLHCDLKPDDTMFYITTCSWMMWNWMLSSLAVGATIILYDGNPAYPDAGAMWKLIEDEKVSVFGTSASYINFLKSQNLRPGKDYNLSALREICQTGSALSAEGFEYVYREIKADLHFNSISGGTEINGCFAIGNPTVPVFPGQLQKRGLGMKVQCYDERGQAAYDKMGELVCEAPAPSMPLYFCNDQQNAKYLESYFTTFPGIWRHGDSVLIHGDTKGVTFYGRSDGVLKPSGVRIGTAEIYSEVEKIAGIADSLAVGQEWQGDSRIILFVKLNKGQALTEELKSKIRDNLRRNASPRHVPSKIIETPDIPYTHNMKKVELAVGNIINGRPVLNKGSLSNPESLDFYERIVPELQKD